MKSKKKNRIDEEEIRYAEENIDQEKNISFYVKVKNTKNIFFSLLFHLFLLFILSFISSNIDTGAAVLLAAPFIGKDDSARGWLELLKKSEIYSQKNISLNVINMICHISTI